MVERGIKGDRPSNTSVATVVNTRPEDLRGQDGAVGNGVGYDGFPPKNEEGVLGDRSCQGGLEGLCDGG